MYNLAISKKLIFAFLIILFVCAATPVFAYTITVTVTVEYDDPDSYHDSNGNDLSDNTDYNWNNYVNDPTSHPLWDHTNDNAGTKTKTVTVEVPEGSTVTEVDDLVEKAAETLEQEAAAELAAEAANENNALAAEQNLRIAMTATAVSETGVVRKFSEDDKNVEYGKLVGDPVIVSTGQFTTSNTDLSYSCLNDLVNVTRTYRSGKTGDRSLGKSWFFNYDTRVIRGVKIDARIISDQAEIEAEEARQYLEMTKASYAESLVSLDAEIGIERESECEAVLNSLGTTLGEVYAFLGLDRNLPQGNLIYTREELYETISGLNNALNSSEAQEYSEVEARIKSDRSNAQNGLNNVVIPQINDLVNTKLELMANWALVQEAVAIKDEMETIAEQMLNEAIMAETHKERNRYVMNEWDDSYLEMTGNLTITMVDESGFPNLYYLEEGTTPDYYSAFNYSDGSINYYPQGAQAFTDRTGDDILILNVDGTYTLSSKDGSEINYDIWGRLSSRIDNNGMVTSYAYDEERIQSLTDAMGRTVSFSWSEGNVSTVTDPAGESIIYGYNDEGRLSSVTDRDGDVVQYTYHSWGDLEKIIKPDGSYRLYNYQEIDGRKVVSSTVDEEGEEEFFFYDFGSGYTEYQSLSGEAVVHFFNEENREIRLVYPDGSFEEKEYDSNGNMTAFTGRTGYTTRYEYDEDRNITRVDYPDGSSETFSYNSFGKVSEHIGQESARTLYSYDTAGNMTSVEILDNLGESVTVTTITYDVRGQVSNTVTEGLEERYSYDSYGNVDTFTDGESHIWDYDYDILGRLAMQTNPVGNETAMEYSAEGRIVRTAYPDGTDELTSYSNRKDINLYTDRSENVYDYTYDGVHKLISIENPLGEQVAYSHRPTGEITSKTILSAEGETEAHTEYVYNAHGELAVVRSQLDDSTFAETSYQYFNGLLWKETDPEGTVTEYLYDTRDRVKTKRTIPADGGDSVSEYFTYTGTGNLKTYTDPRGFVTEYEYTATGQIKNITNPDSSERQFTYDGLNRLVSMVDEEGYETSYIYNGLSLPSTITTPDGTEYREYDNTGRLISVTDRNGHETQFVRDMMGRIISTNKPDGSSENFTYNSRDQILTYTDGNNNTYTNEYDPLGNLIRTTDPDGNDTTFSYTTLGLRESTVTADGSEWTARFDMAGRQVTAINPLGAETSYLYDLKSRILSETDPMERITSYSWDGLDRLTEINKGGELITTYGYDSAGNRTSEKVGSGIAYLYEYDNRNRLSGETNRLGISQSYEYYANGQLKNKNDFNGDLTEYFYNDANRLALVTFADGTQKSFAYDGEGNLTSAINGANGLSYTYDPMNRISTLSDQLSGVSVDYTYDPNGNRTGLSWGDGRTFAYEYGTRNELLSLTDHESLTTTYDYDIMGREIGKNMPNGVLEDKIYDPAGRILSIVQLKDTGLPSADIIDGQSYVYNAAGQKTFMVDEKGIATAYEYDSIGRLSTVYYGEEKAKEDLENDEFLRLGLTPAMDSTVPNEMYFDTQIQDDLTEAYLRIVPHGSSLYNYSQPAWTEYYSYDDRNNIAAKTSGWGEIAYGYNAENQMISMGNRSFGYDSNGNQISESLGTSSISYGYNPENRLSSVYTDDPELLGFDGKETEKSVLYSYDAFGRRSKRIEDGGVNELTLYDGLGFNKLVEGYHDGSYTAVKEYSYGNGRLLTRTSAHKEVDLIGYSWNKELGKDYFSLDSLGSVTMITGNNGETTDLYDYDVFGSALTGDLAGSNQYGYNGKAIDPVTGFYDYGFRDYSPVSMRFTTVDPIKDGFNWYAYVGNDPVNYIDPFGLCAESDSDVGSILGFYGPGSSFDPTFSPEAWNINLESIAQLLGQSSTILQMFSSNGRFGLSIDSKTDFAYGSSFFGIQNENGNIKAGLEGVVGVARSKLTLKVEILDYETEASISVSLLSAGGELTTSPKGVKAELAVGPGGLGFGLSANGFNYENNVKSEN